MKIEIKQPLSLNGIGKRKNQEDSIFPPATLIQSSLWKNHTDLFVVCDGVGGQNKGEIASELACGVFFSNVPINKISTQTSIKQAFEKTQNAFDEYIAKNPESKGMATTLVAVHIHEKGLTVIHCGDSRFYHIRNGKILWQTEDHTVINELIKAGVMTEEEAKDSNRNKISRAIQGNKTKETKPDIHFIKDIQKDDYLLLCSDGVSGSITDTELCDILSAEETNSEKIQTINILCEANSADNYSAYLIQIEDVQPSRNEVGFFNSLQSKINKLKNN